MKYAVSTTPDTRWLPHPWQMALIALCTLILCSCKSTERQSDAMMRGPINNRAYQAMGYETGAYSGGEAYVSDSDDPTEMEQGAPLPYAPTGPWSPPGIKQPWPKDEYVRDGGDRGMPAGANGRAEILGLEMEDTVAAYKTKDGSVKVEPSNEVQLYCPRFGAVRQVVSLQASEERQNLGGVHAPQKLDTPTTLQVVADAKQNIQPGNKISARPVIAMRSKQGDGAMSTAVGPKGFQDGFKPYENLAMIRQGAYEASEMAFLARGATAAIAWSHTQAVQIILNRKSASVDVKYENGMCVYTVDEPPANPKLRLIKVASTPFAEPGEEVDFTIRFDNIGNQPITDVTILDSLNTRLEFVPSSAQCSLDAKISSQANEGDSVVVQCQVAKPLEPGKGGILRFRCIVR